MGGKEIREMNRTICKYLYSISFSKEWYNPISFYNWLFSCYSHVLLISQVKQIIKDI